MTKDALKFFQAFINEMIDVGGANLPKSISMKLGTQISYKSEIKRYANRFLK